MPEMESVKKMSETRRNFLSQANTRMKEVRGMEKDIRRRMKTAPKDTCSELETWFENLESHLSQASVEIEMIENSTEDMWAERRERVDTFLGEAERELETGYEILERPV
ncbi:hypothetical protein [Methanoplanus endosymbiosus]|uniref:Uncharacterized protein n=1 Tax=Methanoplanus endosymbiosus TaxID=33865 RepID=A0A9E7TKZ9_9EURY|nr:hypothetical protein [Methanoplanus endosymbiosus]UUX93180.1 hypothetical protein L6E24_03395 [Methanoplanus endosymbiosus]